MSPSAVNILVTDEPENGRDSNKLWRDDEALLFVDNQTDLNQIFIKLTYRVSRKPTDLLAHLRRIYFCHQHVFSEALYSALLDLLIVLNGKGQPFSRRLIRGCKSRLDPTVLIALERGIDCPARLSGNHYSLFSTGLLGSLQLVESHQPSAIQRDFLTLANDCIEYSQLEEAMAILEQGLTTQPQRHDAQRVLLELYKSTDNRSRFETQLQLLKLNQTQLIEEWWMLEQFFNGQSS